MTFYEAMEKLPDEIKHLARERHDDYLESRQHMVKYFNDLKCDSRYDALYNAFTWRITEEGYSFWASEADKLTKDNA